MSFYAAMCGVGTFCTTFYIIFHDVQYVYFAEVMQMYSLCSTEHTSQVAETTVHLACKHGSPVSCQHRSYQRQMHSDTVRKQDRSHFPTLGRTTNT